MILVLHLGFVGLIMFVTGKGIGKSAVAGKKSSVHKRKYYSSYIDNIVEDKNLH